MGVLAQLEPKEVFSYFETICGIPHGSGNTGPIADYLVKFAQERGLGWYRDSANNVVITKPASPGYEDADTVILQAHTDMVCEKDAGVEFDFTKDAIRLVVEGDTLRADGTTLGADDGISVAMILALLDDPELKHPKIEALLTSDEEIGLIGAFAFDCSHLTGHKLINLDSEYEGVLMCSCAGGANAYSTIPVAREACALRLVEVSLSGWQAATPEWRSTRAGQRQRADGPSAGCSGREAGVQAGQAGRRLPRDGYSIRGHGSHRRGGQRRRVGREGRRGLRRCVREGIRYC